MNSAPQFLQGGVASLASNQFLIDSRLIASLHRYTVDFSISSFYSYGYHF